MAHIIIYIPGLHDETPPLAQLRRLLPLFWLRYGFSGIILSPQWSTGAFEAKLQMVTDVIDKKLRAGHLVSLVGQSAGSSLALNAFAARNEFVTGLVILTGRLRVAGVPSLANAARHSVAFAESVRRAEPILSSLSTVDRLRIMTIRPSVDKVVPHSSVSIQGAMNINSGLRGHSFAGAMLASVDSNQWLSFLSSIPCP